MAAGDTNCVIVNTTDAATISGALKTMCGTSVSGAFSMVSAGDRGQQIIFVCRQNIA